MKLAKVRTFMTTSVSFVCNYTMFMKFRKIKHNRTHMQRNAHAREYAYFNRKNTVQRGWHYLERTREISSRRVTFDGGGNALGEIIVPYGPERGTQWNGDCNF